MKNKKLKKGEIELKDIVIWVLIGLALALLAVSFFKGV